MEELFNSIISNSTVTISSFLIILGVSLLTGIALSLFASYKGKSSKNFYIANAILPLAVAMVIMLVNGNIGIGVAVAGAFGLVRFRSAQGSAREIAIIFISMACGLAFGVGYIAYGIIFALICGIILLLSNKLKVFNKKTTDEKTLKITIPESLDYSSIFDDLFEKYTKSYDLIKTKSTNMGSLFILTYDVVLKDIRNEKKFIDELRCRNGNLEIQIGKVLNDNNEL